MGREGKRKIGRGREEGNSGDEGESESRRERNEMQEEYKAKRVDRQTDTEVNKLREPINLTRKEVRHNEFHKKQTRIARPARKKTSPLTAHDSQNKIASPSVLRERPDVTMSTLL